jgi:hypothetical protein
MLQEGGTMFKSVLPPYVIWNRYNFIFRIQVPMDVRRAISKTELRISLKTGDRKITKVRAMIMAARLKNLFLEMRQSGMKNFTGDEVEKILKACLEKNQKDFCEKYGVIDISEKTTRQPIQPVMIDEKRSILR